MNRQQKKSCKRIPRLTHSLLLFFVCLLRCAEKGRDATREFEDVGHSSDARTRLNMLEIGTVRPATDAELRISRSQGSGKVEARSVTETGKELLTWVQENSWTMRRVGVLSMMGAVVIGVAVAVQRYAYRARR